MQAASRNEITLLRKLKLRKHRQKEQMFVVEGFRAVYQLLANGIVDVVSVFTEERFVEELTKTNGFGEKIRILSKEDLDHVVDTETPQGIIALCNMPSEPVAADLFNIQKGVIVAFDRIQDPGNAGTMIRTAAWFGAQGILLSYGSVDVYNPKVVRSTAGATGTIPVLSGEMNDLLKDAEASGWQVIMLDASAESFSIREVHPPDKSLLLIGNEANGVDPKLYSPERMKVRIAGEEQVHVESLNAAIALGIGLFELLRH